MSPELHLNMPFEEYRKVKRVSQSTLKHGRTSMRHLKHAMDNPGETTDAMRLGSALHCACLEPALMADEVAVWKQRRAGEEWKAFESDNEHRIILTETQYGLLKGMASALRQHPVFREWIGRIQEVEVSAFATLEGVECKGRTDALTDEPLIDLKSTGDLDIGRFIRTTISLGYDIQGALYTRLFERERFMLLVVESKPPYDVVAFELKQSQLDAGWRGFTNRYADHVLGAKELLHLYKQCEEQNYWPGRSDELIEVHAPEEINEQVRISA